MKSPLFPVALTFLIGIIAASLLPVASFIKIAFLLASISVTLFFIFRKNKSLSTALLLILIFFAGFIRFIAFNELPKDHIKHIATEEKQEAFLKGTIVSNPVFKRKYGYYPELEYLLKTEAVQFTPLGNNLRLHPRGVNWKTTSGLVLVKAYFSGEETFEYGDKVLLKGKLSLPRQAREKGEFDYRKYLAAKKVYAICKTGKNDVIEKTGLLNSPIVRIKRRLYSIKAKATRNILINLPPPHSSILAAMLLGDRQYLSNPIKDIFVKTGTMHILAISGLHVGIIVFIFLGLFKLIKIPKRIAYIFTIALIILYALMVGQRPSVWRASIMASVLLLSFVLNRQGEILNTLSLALLILIIPNPNYIFDAGFILSFACVASIIWISPVIDRTLKIKNEKFKMKNYNEKLKILFYARKTLSISLAVWIGIMPIIAYYFHIITPVTILANLVAVPICFVLVSLGIAALLFGLFLSGIGIFFYETAWLANKAMLLSLNFFSVLPGAFIKIKSFPVFYIFIYYVILVFVIVTCTRPGRGIVKNAIVTSL
ncbi:MAG: ComEC family competence protein [Candidatus Omnitrophica bacterium]|nr:ComEC family competence protein [Candidatus Omnitrophota bacterium]